MFKDLDFLNLFFTIRWLAQLTSLSRDGAPTRIGRQTGFFIGHLFKSMSDQGLANQKAFYGTNHQQSLATACDDFISLHYSSTATGEGL